MAEDQVVQEVENWNSDDFVAFGDGEEDEEDYSEQNGHNEQTTNAPFLSGESGIPPWMMTNTTTVPPASHRINPLVDLHNEIVDFYDLMSPLPAEISQRQKLVDRFKEIAYSAFGKKANVQLFGSQATGLFLPSSDIDLVILLEKQDETKGQEEEKTKKEMEEWDASSGSPLVQLATGLQDERQDELSYLELIENTRVPLVKFTHTSGVSFDVCFDQDTGPKAALLMKTYMDAMPPLRPLAFVLKYFMESRGLNEPYSGGVGSYMLQLMIVSFLQHRERDGYNFRRPSLYNLGCLLVEFFELYGLDFNYVTTGLSVRHDGFYFPKGAKDRKDNFWQPNRRFSMAIENPLEPTHDVGKPSFRIQVVQRSFELAFKTLLAHLTEPVVPAVSTLASILPPTPEMMQRVLQKSGASPTTAKRQVSNNSNMETSSDEEGDSEPPAKRRKR
jgi:non-canonical poly(A) RNA polymerase PAPD5/7